MESPAGERILVVGASGNLGRTAVEALVKQGYAVRAMARDRPRLEAAVPRGVEVVAGDATSASAVDAALRGCAGVHLCLAHGADEPVAVETVARAADRHGLRRITYVSGTSVCEENAHFPMVAGKLRAERTLQAGRVPWTLFKPTWFMEVLENFFQHGRAICFGAGAMRFQLLASADFAAQVARAYGTREAENRAFQVHGPEPIRLVDAIERVRAALHPEVPSVTHLPFGVARAIAALRGRAGRPMAEACELVRYFESAKEAPSDPDTERILGTCSTTLEAWLQRRRSPGVP